MSEGGQKAQTPSYKNNSWEHSVQQGDNSDNTVFYI